MALAPVTDDGLTVSSLCYDERHRACLNGPHAVWSWCECTCHAE